MTGGVDNLVWKLANDSLDKINKGEVVINANTTFNGDATIVSQGENETTIIKGGSITFTRDGYPITVIRNVQVGEIETDSEGKGILSFPRFKNMSLMLSIKSFNISQNIRSLGCYANLINTENNTYQFFLYGKESGLSEGYKWTLDGNLESKVFTTNCMSISLTNILIKIPSISTSFSTAGHNSSLRVEDVGVPEVNVKAYLITEDKTLTIYNKNHQFYKKLVASHRYDSPSVGGCPSYYYWSYNFIIGLDIPITINNSETSFNLSVKGYRVEVSLINNIYTGPSAGCGNTRWYSHTWTQPITFEAHGLYNLEKVDNLKGNGTLFYIAMEN